MEEKILENIRQKREELGLSQNTMADELGIGRTTYLNFEKGKINIFCKTLSKFARYCGVSERELICGGECADGLLCDYNSFEEKRIALVKDYENRLSAMREKLDAAERIIQANEITIKTLNETKDFLMGQLRKND